MLPGKQYTPEDILKIVRQRIWLLLVPFAVVSAGVATWAMLLPDVYRSETLILVVPQRVPENYVTPTVTAQIEDRLESMSETIQSRTRLEGIILDLDLYAEERRAMLMEDVVSLMRRNIYVDVVRNDAFRVTYTGKDPRKVMQTTERLASLFIEESYIDRQAQAEGTDAFLESQIEEVRQRLVDRERRLEAYRREHSGGLPSQLQAALQQSTTANNQIQSAVDAINTLLQRRILLERQLGDLQAPGAVATVAADLSATSPTGQQLAAARQELVGLETKLRPGHPDLDLARRRIRDLEGRLAAEVASVPRAEPGVSPAEQARRKQVAGLQEDIAELDRQVAQYRENERNARTAAQLAQQRIDAMPTRESEMADLMRDYSALDDTYQQLLAKREQSKIASNLERRQIGEQFRLLDPAQVAERPSSPNRPQLTLMGMFAGIALGAVLVGFVEYRDRTFKTDEDLSQSLGLPVLAVVPLMESEDDRRRARVRRVVATAGLGSLVSGCLAVVAYTFLR